MNKKFSSMLQPSMRFYFIILILFAVVTFFFGPTSKWLAGGEAVIILLLAIYTRIASKKRGEKLLEYIESVTDNMDTATMDTLKGSPLPVLIFSPRDDLILWSNARFRNMTGEREHLFEARIGDLIPGFSSKWLIEGKVECPDLVTVGQKQYKVFGSIIKSERSPGVQDFLATTYWVDLTEYAAEHDRFNNSRPVAAILLLDNYDELLNGMSDKEKSVLLADIDDRINDWAGGCGGYLCKYDRDRYIFLFEAQYLKPFVDGKFAILDRVREVIATNGMRATLSIGVGKDGDSLDEDFRFASLGVEMALSRGGDQAVIKNKYNFEFYGGRSAEFEKRTKVRSRVLASAFGELVNDASAVLIMGHKFADLDSIGAAVGVCCIARARGKRARIVVDLEKNLAEPLIEHMRQLPEYADVFISAQDAMIEADGKSLLVVVDTNRPEQVESESLLLSCNRVAVIDHHRRAATYIQNADLNFHEPYASSASELVAEMLQYLVEKSSILRYEAEAIMAGIVLDTKSFAIRTGSRTFDAAAFLRRVGADTSEVKKLLQSDLSTTMARYDIIKSASLYKSGIAIAVSDRKENRIIVAQAADELLNVAGVEASFVLSPGEDSIDISARSIGSVNVQMILEQLGGGGNKSTAGVQIRGKTSAQVLRELTAAIDTYLAEDNQ